MATANQVREVHKLLDAWMRNKGLYADEVQMVRSLLPELPKQKTLEEITELVNEAWGFTHVNEWDDDAYGSLESWLSDLETQLQGVKETSANVPALPAGMRIAVHAAYGRVVVSPVVDDDGTCKIFHLSTHARDGSDYCWASIDSLTFIDYEPAKYDHPEFLETEADYQNAPAGTVAAKDGWLAWVKQKNGDWSCDGGSEEGSILAQTGKRHVLRWGWTNE